MKKAIAAILVLAVTSFRPPAVWCTVAQEEEAPQYLYVSATVLAGANFFSVFGNTMGLAAKKPNRTFAYLGVIGGSLSIAYAFLLAHEKPEHESVPALFGVTGGLALGLGAFNLRLARHLGDAGDNRLSLSPTLIQDGQRYIGGIRVSVDF